MQGMENLMVVPGNAGGIIGKFFYYSLANILIPQGTVHPRRHGFRSAEV